MKTFIRKMGVVSMLAVSSFTASSIAQPLNAHAAIGAAAWPLFPLIIVGAALEGAAAITGTAAVVEHVRGARWHARHLAGAALSEFLLGIIFLDNEQQAGELQQVTAQQAAQFRMTDAEMQAYNQAVASGDMEAIMQQATQDLSQDSSHDQARQEMQTLLGQLPADAHSGFNKIAAHLVMNR